MHRSAFNIIGLSVRTTNKDGQSSRDIPELWRRFFAEKLFDKIPKISSSLYCVYTDYAKDWTEPYTTILGYEVAHLNDVPMGMMGRTIPGGNFVKFTAKGDLTQGAVFEEWTKIWK